MGKLQKSASSTVTPAQVAQLTGVAWAGALLANEGVIRALCLAEFAAADKNKDGKLDSAEALACVTTICDRFKLELKDHELKDYVHGLASYALRSKGTYLYDVFQKKSNGIMP